MKYFNINEFVCQCCGKELMDDRFLAKLDMARGIAKTPFIVTSGYRCEKHNAEIGSTPTSSHIKGLACDIAFKNSRQKYLIVNALMQVGIDRIGINDEKSFIHCDLDYSKIEKVLFSY